MNELKLIIEKKEYEGKEYNAYYVELNGYKVYFKPTNYQLLSVLLEIVEKTKVM